MYEPPISIFEIPSRMVSEINEQTGEMILKAIYSAGVEVNKDELIKAMQYDRGQYEKGYTDGRTDAIEELSKALCDELDKGYIFMNKHQILYFAQQLKEEI